MDHKIILVAETGSDIPKDLAQEWDITLVPMHVSMGDETLDDGTFPPEDVCAYYDRTGKVPKTSGSSVYDFEKVFDGIFEANPQAQVLYLAYSAVTTVSYQSAQLALEGKPYEKNIRSVDTKHVSAGQCAVVIAIAKWLKDNPEASLDQAAQAAVEIGEKTQMCFLPDNLDYLRAGGRCSNATALIGNFLQIHPCIEIIDGRLIARKKYRGRMQKIAPTLLHDFDEKHTLERNHLYFIHSPYLDESIRSSLTKEAAAMGFRDVTWINTGCVITCHAGPGTFGIVGVAGEV